ncbi:hypothetical protein C453_19435 [Haloferax elongans ATCC BAA-1513]|uniref:DUF58 domain-containing protein n=1 Tax=Haloferax elongans ATCC BAA-1513 TaxID=1230453 RepID=M0HAY8_HALEO|nr:DUF58 domain-containing protein [Haloferax elongans]ELZ80279.1 hypothetical protein C453_19435 [Haloferax elongans ATCC BAA-1513]
MSSTNRIVLVVGLVSSLTGLCLVALPSVASLVSLSGVARTAPIALVGMLSLLLAARYVAGEISSSKARHDEQQTRSTEFPTPKHRPGYEHPGVAFARRLGGIEWTDRREEDPKERLELRAELRQAARTVLSRTEQWSRTDVETRLDDGTWTENPQAAAFFADDVVPSLSPWHRVRSLCRSEPVFARRARHAVSELASRFDGNDVSPEVSAAAQTSLDDDLTVTTRSFWDGREGAEAREVSTGRTRGVAAAALGAAGLGIVTLRPALFLLTVFGITVYGYARAVSLPTQTVSVTRTVSEAAPDPGQEIEITVSVLNTGDETLADIRVVDGVPTGLIVSEGSPTFTTALRPGKEATFSYSVEAVAGAHTYDPALVVTRDVAGVRKRERLQQSSETTITCQIREHPVSGNGLQQKTTVLPGQAQSRTKGAGVEFHSVREYRHGDPLSRIDWNRKAKTGEFTTVDFREPHLETTLLVVDARAEAYLESATDCTEPVVRQSVTAAYSIASQLLADSTPVGITALSPQPCWLSPGTGDVHRRQLRELLLRESAFSWDTPDGEFDAIAALREINQRASLETQILFISPLCDDEAREAVRRLDAYGYTVSVLSPDPTVSTASTRTCGVGYASLRRQLRLKELRNAGLNVTDWDPSEPFSGVISRE